MTGNIMMQPQEFWDFSAAFAAANVRALLAGEPLAGVVRNATATAEA